MTEIRASRSLVVPPVPSLHALRIILERIERNEPEWRDFALHVDLHDVGLPDVGFISIPVQIDSTRPNAALHQSHLTIRAAKDAQAFPTFAGSIGIDATGSDSSRSILWLAGTYTPPLGTLGNAIDAALLRHLAKRTLENFLDDMARAVNAQAQKSEADEVRTAFHNG